MPSAGSRIAPDIGERRSSQEKAGMYDLLIRGATVVDALGRDPRRADVAASNSRIAAIGEIASGAAEVIDAGGLAPMPGLLGIPTPYDPPPPREPTLSPSPSRSATPAPIGNSRVG